MTAFEGGDEVTMAGSPLPKKEFEAVLAGILNQARGIFGLFEKAQDTFYLRTLLPMAGRKKSSRKDLNIFSA